jgi:hypothetical protein
MTLDKQWISMIDGAPNDDRWDEYDTTIQGEVNQYRTRLLWLADWLLFKAQVWTESGAASPSWKTRPMQIGNPGDPAYATIKHQKEHSDLIMSETLKTDIKNNRSINDPIFNIQVAMAYAYTKVAIFGSVVTDPTVREYTVQSGDNVDNIAIAVKSTPDNIFGLNPGAQKMIFKNQKLKYQQAEIKIIGRPIFTPEILQDKYNGNGDSSYAEKIRYCLPVCRGKMLLMEKWREAVAP